VRILFATGNSGKLEEAMQMLPGADIRRLEVETVEPQEGSLSEISKYKVRTAAENAEVDSGFVMADDSGLFVDELDGFPGSLSHPFEEKVGKEGLLELIEDRSASFRCSIALLDREDREVEVFTGSERVGWFLPGARRDLATTRCSSPRAAMRPGAKTSHRRRKAPTERRLSRRWLRYWTSEVSSSRAPRCRSPGTSRSLRP
jgi:XTP/dITP diphosphohydrolase